MYLSSPFFFKKKLFFFLAQVSGTSPLYSTLYFSALYLSLPGRVLSWLSSQATNKQRERNEEEKPVTKTSITERERDKKKNQ